MKKFLRKAHKIIFVMNEKRKKGWREKTIGNLDIMSFLPDFEAIVSERRDEDAEGERYDGGGREEKMRPLFSSHLHACQRRKDALFPSSLSSLGLSQFGKARRKEKEENCSSYEMEASRLFDVTTTSP